MWCSSIIRFPEPAPLFLILKQTGLHPRLFPKCPTLHGRRRGLLSVLEQIRPVAPRFLDRRGPPPLRHLRVIPPNQHFRDAPPAALRRPRIMRKIQKNRTPASSLLSSAHCRLGPSRL